MVKCAKSPSSSPRYADCMSTLVTSILRAVRALALVLLTRVPPVRVAAEVAAGVVAPRQPAGVLAAIVEGSGTRVLVASHLTRPSEPWGLPGGWLEKGEVPEAGLVREVHEELGLAVTPGAYLGSGPRWNGRLRPRGIALIFRAHLDDPTRTAEVRSQTWEVAATRWVTADEAAGLVDARTLEAIRRALAPSD